jgi:diguanylate cyclase (GGDEF)-like protein
MCRTILIVEDDPADRARLERDLLDADYRVLAASDGETALRLLRDAETPPTMLITDWGLPGMDGLELCRRIREFEGFAWIFTIVVTSSGDEDRLVQALESAADDFVTKPFSTRELIARIRAGQRVVDLERDLARQRRELFRSNAEIQIAYRKLTEANDRLSRMASTDELTGLPNRRACLDTLEQHWADGVDAPLAIVMADIDHFKRFNDSYGHDIGDHVLQATAHALQGACGPGDLVHRIGGEEFLITCRGAMDRAQLLAESLCNAMRAMPIEHVTGTLNVTASFGVAVRTPRTDGVDQLIKAADDALYEAKRAGRNCIRPLPGDDVQLRCA